MPGPKKESTPATTTTTPTITPAIPAAIEIIALLKMALLFKASELYLTAISIRTKPTISRAEPANGTIPKISRIEPTPPNVLVGTKNPCNTPVQC